MPLRKRKGGRRRQKAPSPCPTENETSEGKDLEVGRVNAKEETPPETRAVDCSMDEEEKRARETIELLSKKYQAKLTEESKNTLDIIRVDDSELAQYEEIKDVEKENKRHPLSPLTTLSRPRIVPQKRTVLQKPMKLTSNGSTPSVFKVPNKPLATNHSTPAPSGDRCLFGFEELDSPLTLSPVTTTPAGHGISSLSMVAQYSRNDEEEEKEEEVESSNNTKLIKPSPYSRLKGTYDIPFKKKTPKRQPGRKRKSNNTGEKQWVKELNVQFTEVEQFELAVE